LETGERGGEERREWGGLCWVRTRCDTVVIVVIVIAVEVGLLVNVNTTHLQWLTGEGRMTSGISEIIVKGRHTVVEVSPRPLGEEDGCSSHNDG